MRFVRQFAAAALAAGLAACADTTASTRATDHLGVLNHVSCYPFGLDQIGRNDVAAGTEIWKACFAPDYKFSVFLGFGEPTVCPGEKCTLAGATSIEKRAALARRVYDGAGYVRTSHHLSNQNVAFTGPGTARMRSYISAWHAKADGSIVTGLGEWTVDLARSGDGWLITNENLTIVAAGALQSLRR